jgi:actin-related protein
MATASLYHQLSSFNTITPETLECIAHSYVKEFYFSLENQHGLLRAFLDSALSCPIDLRRSMLQNVVFIGGSILSMYNMKQYFFTTLTSLFSTKGDFDELPLLVTDMVWNQYSQLLSNLQSTATAAYHENEPIKIADNSLSFLHPLPFSPAHVTWVGGGLCIDNIASLRLNQGEVRPLSVNSGV